MAAAANLAMAESVIGPDDIPSIAIPKSEEGLQKARQAPAMELERIYIQAPHPTVHFFLQHPRIAFNITRYILGKTGMRLEKEDEEDEMEKGQWLIRSQGAKYRMIPLTAKSATGLAGFRFSIPVPILNNAWIGGHGLMKLDACPGEDAEETILSCSLYLAMSEESDGWNAAAKVYAQSQLRQEAMSMMESFKYLCEEVAYDPESIAGDMESEEDLFTMDQIRQFKKQFLRAAAKKR